VTEATATLEADASAPAEAPPSDPQGSNYYFEIFLVSLAGLLLEISYTRIISYKLFYYFTYLVIGLALLGLGAGGVLVAISGRLRRASTDAILLACVMVGAVVIALGYVFVAWTSINTFTIWQYGRETVTNGGVLLIVCLVLFFSFLPTGIVLATLFGRRPEKMGRLYFADLLGAAIACAAAVPLMASAGPPATIMLAALLFVIAGVRIALRQRSRWLVVAPVLAVVLAACIVAPQIIPEVRPDSGKSAGAIQDDKLVYSSWSPLFRVDVRETAPTVRGLFHDGLLGSFMYKWDGEESSLDEFGFDLTHTRLPFVTGAPPPENELIIGAAAGHETLASLHFDAKHIDAIELNPVTYNLVTDRMAEYGGHLADHPRVNYVNADGRSYLARSDKKYDLIWYPAPDSYSATNSGSASAYVLSESYLYTSDAVVEGLEHLAPNGLIVNQFGDNQFNQSTTRTARYIETVRAALIEQGVERPERNIVITTAPARGLPPLSTIYTKMAPFTDAEIASITASVETVPRSRVVYAPGQARPELAITRFVLPEADADLAPYKYSVGTITDDKPFFWHFTPFTDAVENIRQPVNAFSIEVGVGERVLLLLLAFAVGLSAIFLLVPFIAIRKTWSLLPRKPLSALYFMAIGLAFMFFEITMIQKLVLFLGFPTYSLTVTLSSLLIFVGLGALLSGKLQPRGKPLIGVAIVLAVLTAYYLWGLTPTTDALLGASLGVRVAVAFLLLAPLGLALGIFMPLGVRTIAGLSEHDREYVAWGWALNGFASVIGSILATILAMTWGFQVVLVVAFCVYLVAIAALRGLSRGVVAPSA